MDRLWAPWRNAYVSGGGAGVKPSGCIFCAAASGATERADLVVHRSAHNVVVMNLYPYNTGHVMVAPLRHLGSLGAAEPEELSEMMGLARRLEAAFTTLYKPDGINVGMNLGRAAGAGIDDHIHLHLLPRWNGDTNFMTTVGEIRVMSEEPAQACARLRPFFA